VLQGNLKTEQIILHKKCGPIKHLCCAVALILVAEMVRQIAEVHFFLAWPKLVSRKDRMAKTTWV